MTSSKLFTPLTLPNGTIIPNRVGKAAMEENLASIEEGSIPSTALLNLYRAWSSGGAGLIITGNVMVDRRAMTGPGGVALETEEHLEKFREWAEIARGKREKGTQVWMQINHPGRQMRKELGQRAFAPSAVPLDMGRLSKLFVQPEEMTEVKIQDIISRFVTTARLAEKAGFTGVEVHAAHGYLLSQFLSPLTNLRSDSWGGSLPNRSKLLFTIITQIRSSVSSSFSLGVKLNSADFQRGGFTTQDAIWVVREMNKLGVDLLELSGGSYESPAMNGTVRSGSSSTLKREAYFLEFAKEIIEVAEMPVMLTGGITRREVMDEVLNSGVAIVGLATALAVDPHLPNKLLHNEPVSPITLPTLWYNDNTLRSLARMGTVKWYLRRLGNGVTKKVWWEIWPTYAIISEVVLTWWRARKYREAMGGRHGNEERKRKLE